MELSDREVREAKEDSSDDVKCIALGQRAVVNRVKMSGRRPDGSPYEYSLPVKPLGVYFTIEGPIELNITDENN